MTIDWGKIITAIGALAAIGGMTIAYVEYRANKISGQIKNAVDHLAEVLLAKLETKDSVADIRERLARVEGKVI